LVIDDYVLNVKAHTTGRIWHEYEYSALYSQNIGGWPRPTQSGEWIFSETLINIHELTQSRRQGGRQARYNTVVSLMSEYSLTRPRDVAADLSEQFQSSLW